jgi:sugar lactone lactonase YvrE
MVRTLSRRLAVLAAATIAAVLPVAATAQEGTPGAAPIASPGTMPPAGVTVVASGLTNPRGFAWGPDGTLYLTLAGTGGDTPGTIDGTEDGIYGGPTAAVVTIRDGCATPLVEGLPSGNWRDAGWIWGAHAVAFLDGRRYVLSAGGGTDFGNPDQPSGVLRVEDDGTTTVVADFSTWSLAHPPAFVSPDYNPSGSLFDMVAGTDRLWISDAVGGRILTVTPDGAIALVADISDGHPVPTGLALAPDGGVYVGNLTAIPYPDGSAKVIHVAPDGTVADVWTGLTAVTDIATGPDGALYAVELATGNLNDPPFARPGSGRVVRMTGPNGQEPVVTDAAYPTNLGFGPDGALYLAQPGFAPADGAGQGGLLRIDLTTGTPISLSGLRAPEAACPAGTPVATPAA